MNIANGGSDFMVSQWIEVADINDFNQSNKKVVRINNDLEVLIIKVKDSFFAVENRCSHDEKPLDSGKIVDEKVIECNYHGARFDITTGKALKMPAVAPINIFKTKVENQKIYILLD